MGARYRLLRQPLKFFEALWPSRLSINATLGVAPLGKKKVPRSQGDDRGKRGPGRGGRNLPAQGGKRETLGTAPMG